MYYSQDVIIRTFTGKVKYHMIELLRQYRDMVSLSGWTVQSLLLLKLLVMFVVPVD